MSDSITQYKIFLQKQYIEQNNKPMFAPENGRCWSCGENVYKGHSIDDAATVHITGCPYCNTSFIA